VWLSAFKWYPWEGRHGAIYASRTENGRNFHMQRDILDPDRAIPRTMKADHRDGDTLNNQRSNLRWSTNSQSNANRRLFKNNTSGFRGVSWEKRKSRWVARIKHNSKGREIGLFHTREEAAAAYNRVARELHGEFAVLNIIPGATQP